MEYTKRNIKIRVVALSIAFVLWFVSTYFLWESKARFSSFFVLFIIVVSIVKDYFGWRKYKKENSQIKG